jgi:hypothetical protein
MKSGVVTSCLNHIFLQMLKNITSNKGGSFLSRKSAYCIPPSWFAITHGALSSITIILCLYSCKNYLLCSLWMLSYQSTICGTKVRFTYSSVKKHQHNWRWRLLFLEDGTCTHMVIHEKDTFVPHAMSAKLHSENRPVSYITQQVAVNG